MTTTRALPEAVSRAIANGPQRVVMVLIPTNPYTFGGYAAGHRALHCAGDLALGVGVLITQPEPTRESLEKSGFTLAEVDDYDMLEAGYAHFGDWIVYAAPNDLTNPYLIDVRSVASGADLASEARSILDSVDQTWVSRLRRRMPFIECARCNRPCGLFVVSDEEWLGVGEPWLKKVLCRACYDELTNP